MSGKKSRKTESESESEGEEEDDKPTLLSPPKLKPPKAVKPAAASKAAPQPPPPAVPQSAGTGGELYTWEKAIELGRHQLEDLYGKASAETPLPFQIRNIFGNILCPTKDGQDFYLPAEQINIENVRAYYDSIVCKIPDTDIIGKAVKSWYLTCNKRGLVKCFQDTMPLMQQEIRIVLELLNRETETRRAASAAPAPQSEADSAVPGSKRKGGSVSASGIEEDTKRPREEEAARAPLQSFSSVSDFRRSYYSRTPVAAVKPNHHDLSDGYDISALVTASQGAADVGAIRKVEVSTYRNRALPF